MLEVNSSFKWTFLPINLNYILPVYIYPFISDIYPKYTRNTVKVIKNV